MTSAQKKPNNMQGILFLKKKKKNNGKQQIMNESRLKQNLKIIKDPN